MATLSEDANNARSITEEAMSGLGVSLETFGDLSGIVFNLTTGELVAGHQRMRSLKEEGATEWTRQGDIAWIEHPKTGERFAIRLVEWDRQKQRLANLTANNPSIGGDFTDAAIGQLDELAKSAAEEYAALGLDDLARELQKELDAVSGHDEGDGDGNESGPTSDGPVVVIECSGAKQQLSLIARFEKEGLKCRTKI